VRIAILWPARAPSPDVRSGIPLGMQRGLEAVGAEVIPVYLGPGPAWDALPGPLGARARFARSVARRVDLGRAAGVVDAVLAPACAEVCVGLRTRAPVVFATDAACGFGGPIVGGRHRPAPFSRLRRWVNAAALRRARAVIVATEGARRHAVEAFGADPDRVHVSALGANAVAPHEGLGDRPAPSPDGVRLVQVAASPGRKRVDDGVAAVGLLRERGVRASLTLIGPPTPAASRSPYVDCLGRLRLSSPADAAEFREALLAAHMMLMPSRAEAFGIAACEGAHFGLPVIATRVGGLAEIVRDGRTGLLLPHDASSEAIAGAIERLIADPERWRAMSRSGRALAVEEYTWTRWAQRAAPIIEGVAARAPKGGLPRA